MGLDEACGALWLSISSETRAKIEAHLPWKTYTMTRASEESKDLEDLDANDFGRCFFALSMTLIQGDPENIVAKNSKTGFCTLLLKC